MPATPYKCYDYAAYQVFGTRGDWGLRVKDEHGEFSYVQHYATLDAARRWGRHYAALYANGATTLEIFG